MVDKVQMTGFKKLSAVNHKSPEFLESNYNDNNLCQVKNVILDETKEKIE